MQDTIVSDFRFLNIPIYVDQCQHRLGRFGIQPNLILTIWKY